MNNNFPSKRTTIEVRILLAAMFVPFLMITMILILTGGRLAQGLAAAETAVMVGAGDISTCSNDNDSQTANLLGGISGTVFTTGDNVYDSGTYTEYTECYEPNWGLYKSRTKPAPGNHEYQTSGASGYFNYFGVSSYYAYNLGEWRIYALNSEIDTSATSEQVTWLKQELAANPKTCVMAYWHRARWSSGKMHGSDSKTQALWAALFDAKAEIVVTGHEHNYERFAPMNQSGQEVSGGLREFVVGTGGASHYGFGTFLPASQARDSSTYGLEICPDCGAKLHR
jgi:hypothetical protein